MLRYFLTTVIRHGSVSIVTAHGVHFHCGDETGAPLKVRFLTNTRPAVSCPIEQGSIGNLIPFLFDLPERLIEPSYQPRCDGLLAACGNSIRTAARGTT